MTPPIAQIFYLEWHQEDQEHRDQAQDLFHEFHHDPPTALTEPVFDDLYEEVAGVETNDLEELFAEWNAGSGHESDLFTEMRYCEQCQSYIEGIDEATTHAVQNHGYDDFTNPGKPGYIRGIRSMSVGDAVEHGDTHYACAPIGWQEMNILEGDTR